jgi:transposase-like protein
MGHKKVGVPSRRYTNEFKIEAVHVSTAMHLARSGKT